jgi:hypothetical protein
MKMMVNAVQVDSSSDASDIYSGGVRSNLSRDINYPNRNFTWFTLYIFWRAPG